MSISRNSIGATKKVAKKYLAGENIKISTAQKIYANRIKNIPNITGKELDLGFYITGREILQGRKISKKTHIKRIKTYEKIIGRQASRAEKHTLKYMTANKASKIQGIKNLSSPKINIIATMENVYSSLETKKDNVHTSVINGIILNVINTRIGTISWYDLPEDVRMGSRSKGSFLYENSENVWGSDSIDMDNILKIGVDGDDLTVVGFVQNAMQGQNNILIDPQGDGTRIAIEQQDYEDLVTIAGENGASEILKQISSGD